MYSYCILINKKRKAVFYVHIKDQLFKLLMEKEN